MHRPLQPHGSPFALCWAAGWVPCTRAAQGRPKLRQSLHAEHKNPRLQLPPSWNVPPHIPTAMVAQTLSLNLQNSYRSFSCLARKILRFSHRTETTDRGRSPTQCRSRFPSKNHLQNHSAFGAECHQVVDFLLFSILSIVYNFYLMNSSN